MVIFLCISCIHLKKTCVKRCLIHLEMSHKNEYEQQTIQETDGGVVHYTKSQTKSKHSVGNSIDESLVIGPVCSKQLFVLNKPG